MGFSSVYRSLIEIFPQIDARLLMAVASEHPKDADEAAVSVLSDIVPFLPSNLSHDSTHSWIKSSGSISKREVERDLEDVVFRCRGLLVASGSKSSASSSSSSSETIPLVVGRRHDTNAPSTKLVSNESELTNFSRKVGCGVCHKDVKSEEVQSLRKAPGKEQENYDLFGKCFDVPSEAKIALPEDDLACFKVGTGSSKDEISKDSLTSVNCDNESKRSLASVNGDTELGGGFSSSTHGCSVDHLEEIIEDAKTSKKTLLTVMDSVMNLMKEIELGEKDVEKSELEATRGCLDTLEKVEEFKKMLEHAKEANDMHAGDVYGEKSFLATEAKELENRLLSLSEERDKSLAVLYEMRETLEIRLAAASELKKAAEKEKKVKEASALKALAEQEDIMEKVVQESNLLQQEAKENSKLQEFLMDRGQVVHSLQGEISVICQDVKLLKEKFDNRVSITKSTPSSLTSSCGSSMRSLVLETPAEPLNGMLETSSSNKSPDEEASSFMNKERDDCRELFENGWYMSDKEIEL